MMLSKQMPQIEEDCSNLDGLPVLHFVIDGHDFELPPQAYVMRVTGALLQAGNIWDILFFKPKVIRVDMCMPAFMQIEMRSQFGPVWILGMPFFRYYHTTFDRKKQEMRFALAGSGCKPMPFRVSKTASNNTHGGNDSTLLTLDRTTDYRPLDVNVDYILPPTLSGIMDTAYINRGMLKL